jgi:hypothetical protein
MALKRKVNSVDIDQGKHHVPGNPMVSETSARYPNHSRKFEANEMFQATSPYKCEKCNNITC